LWEGGGEGFAARPGTTGRGRVGAGMTVRGLGPRTLAASGLLALVIGGLFGVLLYVVVELRAATAHARTAGGVGAAALAAEKLVIDVETGARGFVITAEPRFLQPWVGGQRQLPARLATLERLVRDDPEQLARARMVATLVESYLREYSR